MAFYSYCVENIDCDYDTEAIEKLRLHQEISRSCFAIWIVPGAAILCERPANVDIVDGKLVGIEWRK
jgi:hypothetical protein